VEQAFDVLLSRLTPSGVEVVASSSHRISVLDSLKTNYSVVSFFRSGSFGAGTSIRYHSDVDYFASLGGPVNGSSATLRLLRDSLKKRFPSTPIEVDSPAVVVEFGTNGSEKYEIVPAHFETTTPEGAGQYWIPDPTGGWMLSSPDSHTKYVRTLDQLRGDRVRPLIRLLKAWKYYNELDISSFYLEMAVVTYVKKVPNINPLVYSEDLSFVLQFIADLRDLSDPTGTASYVTPFSPGSDTVRAKQVLAADIKTSISALRAQYQGDENQAFAYWNALFMEKFPSRFGIIT
jgi:hypothetical protein